MSHSYVRAVERRIARPVVLAVHDVVADLHVLEDLGEGQRRGADHEADGADAHVQQHAAGGLGADGGAHDAAHVVDVALAEIGLDLAAQGVELVAEGASLAGT